MEGKDRDRQLDAPKHHLIKFARGQAIHHIPIVDNESSDFLYKTRNGLA